MARAKYCLSSTSEDCLGLSPRAHAPFYLQAPLHARFFCGAGGIGPNRDSRGRNERDFLVLSQAPFSITTGSLRCYGWFACAWHSGHTYVIIDFYNGKDSILLLPLHLLLGETDETVCADHRIWRAVSNEASGAAFCNIIATSDGFSLDTVRKLTYMLFATIF